MLFAPFALPYPGKTPCFPFEDLKGLGALILLIVYMVLKVFQLEQFKDLTVLFVFIGFEGIISN